jgi:ribonuclease D
MTLITTNAALQDYCASLKSAPYITVDTEFMRERTFYAKLCLIQISGPDKNAVGIDVLSLEKLDLSPLWDLMHDSRILKVFHAARQDIEIILQLSGHVPFPLFDTQIAAMVCGYGDQVGYEALVNDIAKASVDKSSQFTDWSRRPLSDKQLIYALGDVIHLVDIYESLRVRLEKKGRVEWVKEEMNILLDPATYEVKPEEAWKRLKLRSPKPRDLAILRELAAWREREAQSKDVPRSRILRDEPMLDMVYQRPQSEPELARIRGISPDMAKGKFGRIVMDAIAKGLACPESECPRPEIKTPLPQRLAPVVEMLKMLLKIEASEQGVVPRLIASADDLEALAMRASSSDLVLGKGWRHEIFGALAESMLEGKLAMTLEKGKIKKIEISTDR